MVATWSSRVLVGAVAIVAACAGEGPETVTLRASGDVEEGLRLADGAVVPAGDEADLTFHQAMVMSLRSPTPASICARGTVASLGDLDVMDEGCQGGDGWAQFVYLDAASIHALEDSRSRGLGLVVLDRGHQARYRVRVVGDAYTVEDGASVVLEHERVP